MTTPLLRYRPYLFLVLGQLISELGSALGTLATSWLIYQSTGSYTAVGGMWLLYFLPSLAVQLIAGPYLDRWEKKRVLIFAQWTRGAAFFVSCIVLLVQPDVHWPFYPTSLINGLVQPLYIAASQSLIPAVVRQEQLLQANAWLDAVLRVAMIAGPVLGGVIIATLPGELVLALVAAGFALSGGVLFCSAIRQEQTSGSAQPWVTMFREGLHVFRENPLLLRLAMYLAAVQFAVGITMVLTIPYVADELHGTSLHLGIFQAGFPVGYLLGSLLIPSVSRLFPQRSAIMLGSLAVGGASFVALGLVHNLYLAIIIEGIAGIAAPFFHVHSTSIYQQCVPPSLMGRVFSVRLLIMRITMPLGVWAGGVFGEILGIRPMYIFMGLLIVIVSALGFSLPFRPMSGKR